MTNPPNYRRVECCGNCIHLAGVGPWRCGLKSTLIQTIKNPQNTFWVELDFICDDYEAGGGE